MKRLILDYYRRWALVLALAAAFGIWLGGFIAGHSDLPFEFWNLLLAMWTGATLVNFDFQRGALRPMAVLPLSSQQLGRSWWLATVPIPATVMTSLLFLGATIFCQRHPGYPFPVRPLVLAGLFMLAWQGVTFAMIFNAARGFGASGGEFLRNSLVSLASIVVFFGSMIFCLNASKSVLKSAILLGAGGLLTIAGWVFAERFDARLAGLYLGRIEAPRMRPRGIRLTPLKLRSPSPAEFAAAGPGGLRYLLVTFCFRGFLTVAILALLLAGLLSLQQLPYAVWTAMVVWLAGYVLAFQNLLPMMRHLRFLRTLPISESGLSAGLIGLAVLPLVGLTVLTALFAWLFLGIPVVVSVLYAGAFSIASVALCVFLAIWQGIGVPACVLLFAALFGFLKLQMLFQYRELPWGISAAIPALTLCLAFLLARLALVRGCGAYRIPHHAADALPMGARN